MRDCAVKCSNGKMKKTVDNTLTSTSMRQYTDILNSVGALVGSRARIGSDRLIGTVFRVGSKYVITAWHCIQAIIGKFIINFTARDHMVFSSPEPKAHR